MVGIQFCMPSMFQALSTRYTNKYIYKSKDEEEYQLILIRCLSYAKTLPLVQCAYSNFDNAMIILLLNIV